VSRVKSTPKEEGGGDKPEQQSLLPPSHHRSYGFIVHEQSPSSKNYLCDAQLENKYVDNKY